MYSFEISRITSRLTFYSLLSVLISIFIIQFLIIESHGINKTSTKNIKVLDKIALDATPHWDLESVFVLIHTKFLA